MRQKAVPKVLVSLERESAAALLAIAVSYSADGPLSGTEFGQRLDEAIQPLRDVVPYEEAEDAQLALKELWGDEASS